MVLSCAAPARSVEDRRLAIGVTGTARFDALVARNARGQAAAEDFVYRMKLCFALRGQGRDYHLYKLKLQDRIPSSVPMQIPKQL